MSLNRHNEHQIRYITDYKITISQLYRYLYPRLNIIKNDSKYRNNIKKNPLISKIFFMLSSTIDSVKTFLPPNFPSMYV